MNWDKQQFTVETKLSASEILEFLESLDPTERLDIILELIARSSFLNEKVKAWINEE